MNHNYNNILGENHLVCSSKLKRIYMQTCINAVKDFSFTACEVGILFFLHNNYPLDTAKDITQYMGISKGLICKNVDSLISKGYLKTRIDDNDKRYIHLSITDTADEAIERLHIARKEFFDRLFNDISDDEISNLKSITSRMMKNFNIK